MRVLLHAVSRATSPTGVCRHAVNLARAIVAADASAEVTVLVGPWQSAYFRDLLGPAPRITLEAARVANSSLSRNLFAILGLAWKLLRTRPDVLHLTYPQPVLPARLLGARLVVSLHDLYAWDAPESFGRQRAWSNRFATWWGLRAADAIAVVSQTTMQRLAARFPQLAGKAVIAITPLPLHAHTPQEHSSQRQSPFLLCVAQHRAHKRLDRVLAAFALLREELPSLELVLVGESGPETETLQALAAQLHVDGAVHWLRAISDAELAQLYRTAGALVSAAFIEGFGLPVAEALAAGCRVLCSRIPAHEEVAGDRACYFAAEAGAEDIAAAVTAALRTPKPLNVPGVSAAASGAQYVELYRSLLGEGRAVVCPGDLAERRATRL